MANAVPKYFLKVPAYNVDNTSITKELVWNFWRRWQWLYSLQLLSVLQSIIACCWNVSRSKLSHLFRQVCRFSSYLHWQPKTNMVQSEHDKQSDENESVKRGIQVDWHVTAITLVLKNILRTFGIRNSRLSISFVRWLAAKLPLLENQILTEICWCRAWQATIIRV